jgi:hypothetical protein
MVTTGPKANASLDVGWRLVADQVAATTGEDRRPIDQARPVLLAAFGGEPSDPATVWSLAGQDRSVALANRAGKPTIGSDFSDERGHGRATCRKHGSKEGQLQSLGISDEAKRHREWRWEQPEVQIGLSVAFGGSRV